MKIFNGTIIKIIDKKTVKAKVDMVWTHPVYKKRVKRSKNYLVHTDGLSLKPGQKIAFSDCKPMSKNKKWKIYNKEDLK